jgi:hypothetical protein
VEFLKKLDHPLLFIFFMLLALKGLSAVVVWGAKSAGWNGLANLLQLS